MKQRRNRDRRYKIKMNLCAESKGKKNRSGRNSLLAKAFRTSFFRQLLPVFYVWLSFNCPKYPIIFRKLLQNWRLPKCQRLQKQHARVCVFDSCKNALTQFYLHSSFGLIRELGDLKYKIMFSPWTLENRTLLWTFEFNTDKITEILKCLHK